jgi:hypothetical protein
LTSGSGLRRDFIGLGEIPGSFVERRATIMAAATTWQRRLGAAAFLAGAALLSGCSSVVDNIPTWAGGLPEGVPERQATPPPYPAVHDLPAKRDDVALSKTERERLQQELADTRERNERAAGRTGSTGGAARNP